MMNYLTKPRKSDKFRGFSYRKTLRDSLCKKGNLSKIIAWEIFYQEDKLATLDTIKEVKHFISSNAGKYDSNPKVR